MSVHGDRSEVVEWAGGEARLAAIAPAWDRLAGRESHPFLCSDWLQAWRRSFAPELTPRVCLVWRGDQLVAGLPLLEDDGCLTAMANDHTPIFHPLAADDNALQTVISAALAEADGVLVLPGVPADHALAADSRWRALTTPGIVSPIVDLVGSFDQWRAITRPRWHAPIERLGRKMAREHQAEIDLLSVPDALRETLEAGFAVEASGWKGAAGTAIAASGETSAFYRAIAVAFGAREELRVSTIALDGQMVAFDLSLLYRNRLWVLKSGFDEARRALAPGLVLRLAVIERCFELGLEAHEFLGDKAEWKSKFATSERAHVTWTGYARGGRAAGRYVARRGRRAVGIAARRLKLRA